MPRPNVFILGAPKCGTTSLAHWLAEHPQVHFCAIKEPQFFNYDYGFRRPMTLRQYEKLFSGATALHRVICEASTRYLYSRTAVPAILSYVDHPRFIVMLRHPVSMAPSLHGQAIFSGDEDEPDFEKAWALQERRMHGDCIPKRCRDPQLLQYGKLCKLGEQLQRLYRLVPREKVHVIHLERIQDSPREEWLRLMAFLGLDDDGREVFPVANSAKVRRLPWVYESVRWVDSIIRGMGVPYFRIGIMGFLYSKLVKKHHRSSISEDMRHRLSEYFLEDLKLLSGLGHSSFSALRKNEK
ncbi:Sulfotransferase family protein [Ectothiorhodospira mobilis]|uniref:Sulfotransferase family protein n=1 Tax=Ectothiorhodospira mobilis TaxID=195064 RepID=A0A1I4RIX8_ECTMO|nr:sulfotransferase [Ectothiorhodospira mobilis]SFM52177.1 Sulfotransferase family protein [Ectothiorhodospira mobilis]